MLNSIHCSCWIVCGCGCWLFRGKQTTLDCCSTHVSILMKHVHIWSTAMLLQHFKIAWHIRKKILIFRSIEPNVQLLIRLFHSYSQAIKIASIFFPTEEMQRVMKLKNIWCNNAVKFCDGRFSITLFIWINHITSLTAALWFKVIVLMFSLCYWNWYHFWLCWCYHTPNGVLYGINGRSVSSSPSLTISHPCSRTVILISSCTSLQVRNIYLLHSSP